MVTSRLAFPFTVLVSMGAARSAHGEPSPHLYYQAPEGCPSYGELTAAIAARGGNLETLGGALGSRTIHVTVKRGDQGFDGALRIDGPDSTSTSRDVHAAQCSEVVDGLALVAALALREPAPTTPAGEPRLQGSSFRQEPTVEVPAGTLRFDRVHRYTLEAGAVTGVFPSVLPRYDLTISVANFVTPPALPSRLVGPILQVRWSFLGPGDHRVDDFTTHAWGFQVGVSSCSGITYDTRGLVLLACGEFGLGIMHYDTKRGDGQVTQSKDGGFGTAGLALDAQYNLSSLFHASLRLGAQMQIGNLSAERPDGSKLLTAPLFGGSLVGGLGMHFQ